MMGVPLRPGFGHSFNRPINEPLGADLHDKILTHPVNAIPEEFEQLVRLSRIVPVLTQLFEFSGDAPDLQLHFRWRGWRRVRSTEPWVLDGCQLLRKGSRGRALAGSSCRWVLG